MKHLTRDEVLLQRLLQRARTIAVIGASDKARRHSRQVCDYLHRQAYEVMPVRPDGADVAGLKSWPTLDDVPGPVDIVVIFRRRSEAPAHVTEALRKRPDAIWLPPGVWSRRAAEIAADGGVVLVEDACIEEEHRHAQRVAGHPRKGGVHVGRRKRSYTDNRKRPDDKGWVAGGGGGHAGGGGVRAALDEKKMVAGRPSPRRGRVRAQPKGRVRGRHGAMHLRTRAHRRG